MENIHEDILLHFNITETQDLLNLTLISPNVSLETMQHIKNAYQSNKNIKTMEVVIIECPNFDDSLLTVLAQAIPESVTSLSLDFTGCESLRGEGFLQLFENIDGLDLTKFSLDIGSVFNINNIVLEGLVLFLSNLNNLQELCLDFYQIDMLTEQGYLALAETIAEMNQLTSFHLDLSANDNLTEDVLEIIFEGLSRKLKYFTFKILDIDHIGGGSFFKLAESMSEMAQLEKLDLTISSFSSLNQKGVYSILKAIGKLEKLQQISLNISNIDLPAKMITYLVFGKNLRELNLDLSCNRKITFSDGLNLASKLKEIQNINLNLDFCSGLSEDTVEEMITTIAKNNKCKTLILRDRDYSVQFQSAVAETLSEMKSLLNVSIFGKSESKKMRKLRQMLYKKQFLLGICLQREKKGQNRMVTGQVLESLLHVD